MLFFTCLTAFSLAWSQFPDPHCHIVDVHADLLSDEDIPDVVLVSFNLQEDEEILSAVPSQTGNLRAIVVARSFSDESARELLIIEYLNTGEMMVLEGIPMVHRPFSNLVWVDDRYLVFDRWSQPHYGIHYVFDALEQELIYASVFPDQFYRDQLIPDSMETE